MLWPDVVLVVFAFVYAVVLIQAYSPSKGGPEMKKTLTRPLNLRIERLLCDTGKGFEYRWFLTLDGRPIAERSRTRFGLFLRLLRGEPVTHYPIQGALEALAEERSYE